MQEKETQMPDPTAKHAAAEVFGEPDRPEIPQHFATLNLSKREAYAVAGLLTLGTILAENPQAVLMTDAPGVATQAAAVIGGYSSTAAVKAALAADAKALTKGVHDGIDIARPIGAGLLAKLIVTEQRAA